MSDAAQLISGRARARFRVVRITDPDVTASRAARTPLPPTPRDGDGRQRRHVRTRRLRRSRRWSAARWQQRRPGPAARPGPPGPAPRSRSPANRRWRVPWPVRRPRRRPRRAARRLHGTTPTRRYGGSPVDPAGRRSRVQSCRWDSITWSNRSRFSATPWTTVTVYGLRAPPNRRGRPDRTEVREVDRVDVACLGLEQEVDGPLAGLVTCSEFLMRARHSRNSRARGSCRHGSRP